MVDVYSGTSELCRQFAGRLPDHYIDAARGSFVGGEYAMALQAIILGAENDRVGVTRDEARLMRSLLDEADLDESDVNSIPIIDEAPPLRYGFDADGTRDLPDPSYADKLIREWAAENNPRWIGRSRRTPIARSGEAATWLYVVETAPDTNEFNDYIAISRMLWTALQDQCLVEVFREGATLPPYHKSAVANSARIWP
ncbi:hypothetical protein ACWDSJ_09345 [Nocardia sp. NPDC003482]